MTELLLAVMEDRGRTMNVAEVKPVESNEVRAGMIVHALLDPLLDEDAPYDTVGEPREALDTHALNDYWVDVPYWLVARNMVGPGIFQVSRAGIGLISASIDTAP